MPHIADKPFLDTLGEDVRFDPQQSVFENIGNNFDRAFDKVYTRNMYRNRARQMNQALEAWEQNQAILRQRMPTFEPHPLPYTWPKFVPPGGG
jgi:hypothetical protein